MNNTSIVAVIGVVVLGAILFFVFLWGNEDASLITPTNTDSQQNQQNQDTDAQNTTNTNSNQQTTSQTANAVVLGEVEGGNTVTIQRAQLLQPGYVVLYRVNSNGESAVVGNTDLLQAGTHTNLAVQLDSIAVDRQAIVAALHEDDGDGTFEYPDADGYLLSASGTVISDIDVVGVERSDQESTILENQVKTYLDANFDAGSGA